MKKKTLSILIPSGVLAGILVMVFLGNTYIRQGIQGQMKTAQVNPQELAAMMKEKAADRVSPVHGEPYYLDSSPTKQLAAEAMEYHYLTAEVKQASGASSYMGRDEAVTQRFGSMERAGRLGEGVLANNGMGSPRYASLTGKKVQPTSLQYGASMPIEYPVQFAGQDSVIVIQPLLPATGTGEMIIRTAELRLEVENGKETYKKISEICQELGGYLAESNFFRDDLGRESGRVTLRIPKDKFLIALEKLDTLGKVKDSNTASQDVSQDYANLKSQLDAAKIVYDKMLEALKKRQNTIPEAIKLESELTPVLRRIEVLKNQIERLNNLTSFTTITVNFYESEVSAKVLEDTKQLIKKEMLAAKIRATRWFAQNMLFVGSGVALFVVVVAAIAMLAAWIKQLIKRN